MSALKLDSNDSPAAVSADKYLDNLVQHGAELTNSNNHSALHMQVMPFTSHDDSDDHNDEDWTSPTNAIVAHSCQTQRPHKPVASVKAAGVANSNKTHRLSSAVCICGRHCGAHFSVITEPQKYAIYDMPTSLQGNTPTPLQCDRPIPTPIDRPTPPPGNIPTSPQNQPSVPDQYQTSTFLRHLLTADFPEKVMIVKVDSSNSPATVSVGKHHNSLMQHSTELDDGKNCRALQIQVIPSSSDEDELGDDDGDHDNDEDWTPPISVKVKHSCQTRAPHKPTASVKSANVTNSNITHKSPPAVSSVNTGKATSSNEIARSESRQDWAEAWVESNSVCSEPRRLLKMNAVARLTKLKVRAGTNKKVVGRKSTASFGRNATRAKTIRSVVKNIATSEEKYEKCKFCSRMICKRFLNRHLHFKHPDVTTNKLEKYQHCEVMLNVKNKVNLRRHLHVYHPLEYKSAWRSVHVQCKLCDQVMSKCGLPQHMQDFHSVDVTSDLEAKVGGSSGSFDQIKLVVPVQIPDVERVKCSLCDRLVAKSYLHKHMQRQHTEGEEKPTHYPQAGRGYKSKKCRKCVEIFDKDSDLQLHMTWQHEQEMLSCKVCSRQYPSQVGLSGHLKVAHAINSVECELCGKTFSGSRKTQFLERHRAKIHKLLEYMCHICGKTKSFSLRKSLTAHVEAHNRIRHCFCEACGKGFLRESGLCHHRKTHDDDVKESEWVETSRGVLWSNTDCVKRSGTGRKGGGQNVCHMHGSQGGVYSLSCTWPTQTKRIHLSSVWQGLWVSSLPEKPLTSTQRTRIFV